MQDSGIIIVAGVCLLFFLLTFLALTDVARKDFSTGREKVLWWIVASIPFVGGIIYLIAGYRRGKRTRQG